MTYEEFAAPAELEWLIACFWSFSLEESDSRTEHTVVPGGSVTVTVLMPPGPALLRVTGPRLNALRIPVRPGSAFFGLRLQPGASQALTGRSALSLRDQNVELPALEGLIAVARAAADPVPAVSQWLKARFAGAGVAFDEAVWRAAAEIRESGGTARVGEIAGRSGLSERQFLRRFREGVGLSPKEYSRIIRIRKACSGAVLEEVPWAELAAAGGFADQAHLIREFSAIFHWPPKVVSEYLLRIRHVRFVQDREGESGS